MTIPAERLIFLLYLTRKPIVFWLDAAERNESASNGVPIPNPKDRKLSIFAKALVVIATLAKNAAINAGLQGITIAPKNNPKRNALSIGFFVVGVFALGRYFPISISKINKRLINPKITNAIGEITPMTLVKDNWKNVVKINPIDNMKTITPKVTNTPSIGIAPFLDLSFAENLLERNARNPG